MLTTAWVLIEFGNHMADPRNRSEFVSIVRDLRVSKQVTIVPPPPTAGDFGEGLTLDGAREDKEWSLTDCISFVVMQREGLTESLTADRHFEQAGFVALLK